MLLSQIKSTFQFFLNIDDDDSVPVPNDKNASVILIETVPKI